VAHSYAWLTLHSRLHAAVVAVFLVTAAFPDVIFLGASLRLNDQIEAASQHLAPSAVYPHAAHREWWHSSFDNGGALWQSEPMMEFMRYCLWTGNSPYWNPYSAAGSLGPETLVDQKFSALTILYAVFGGGSGVYNILLLGLYWFAVYYVIRIIRERLRLSTLAAIAAAGLFLLNGYSSANVASNVIQNYLYVPFCLHASMSFAERTSARRLAVMALAFVLLLSCTFLPTTFVALMAITLISAGYLAACGNWRGWSVATFGAGYLGAWLIAACILAGLYLPIFDSLPETGILSSYGARQFHGAHLIGILSLFTSSHFFESYNAAEPATAGIGGNVIYHFGIVGLCFAAGGLRSRSGPQRWIVWSCIGLLALVFGRIFALPGITQLIDSAPILRSVGCQYLWGAAAIPLAILVAYGVENLLHGDDVRVPVAATLGVGLIAALAVNYVYGLREPHMEYKSACLVWAAFVAVFVSMEAGTFSTPWPRRVRACCQVGPLVVLMLVEFTADAKFLHHPAADAFAVQPSWLKHIRERIGHGRTMSISQTGLMGELGSAYQIPEVTSLNMGSLPGYRSFFSKAAPLSVDLRWADFLTLGRAADKPGSIAFNWEALDLLGVKYVMLPSGYTAYAAAFRAQGFRPAAEARGVTVFENPRVLPRAFTVPLAPDQYAGAVPLPAGFRRTLSPAEITSYRNADVSIRGRADAPRLLVLTDNWHRNWRAKVNGAVADIVLVEGTFRGVWVPAGAFEVHMSYSPRSLPLAFGLSGVGLSAIAVLLLADRLRNRYRAGTGTCDPGHAVVAARGSA
jgi:hypothetical protein